MATIALAAIGNLVGSSLLGGSLGVATASALGRAAGSLAGRYLDQRLFGAGEQKSSLKIPDSLHLTRVNVGEPIAQTYGRVRIAGQLIWLKPIRVNRGRDKYFATFAIALSEGVVSQIGRIWAEGQQINLQKDQFEFHNGAEDQAQSLIMTTIDGVKNTPAYHGVCYVVFHEFDLSPFGNRIPNFEFEIFRKPRMVAYKEAGDLIQGVALIPGSGEYVLATEKVTLDQGFGLKNLANVSRGNGQTNFENAIDELQAHLPHVKSTSLVVSWFGSDLRCNYCKVQPKVEQKNVDGSMPWSVSGLMRFDAEIVSSTNGAPNFGGTPSDRSVIQAILDLKNRNLSVMFYPFLLMDIPGSSTLPDPWDEGEMQGALPWRGRITLSVSPKFNNSPDQTALAKAEIDQFLGDANPDDFDISSGSVSFSGGQDWGYRRFILHNAHLCALAGGVNEFLVGSELRGLTSIRDDLGRFYFVEALIRLAEEVKSILPGTKVSYAADWSEYFGYHPENEPGAVYFHLDPLWASDFVDFIGIDNYFPLSDWRDDFSHLDENYGQVYNLDYLKANIEGGEYYDWFYESLVARQAQNRTPITDFENEEWVWKAKDIRSWWNKPHYDRPLGIRKTVPTDWVPRSKPIYFTEFGCGSLHLSTNEPNKFLDQLSSESEYPHFSDGSVDGFIQAQYIRAVLDYWTTEQENMIDLAKCYLWCWDARPWPEFPTHSQTWSDGPNYHRGHWFSGKAGDVSLANVIYDICHSLEYEHIDVSQVYGSVSSLSFRGDESGREKLELLLNTFLLEVVMIGDVLHFRHRSDAPRHEIDEGRFIEKQPVGGVLTYLEGSLHQPQGLEIAFINVEGGYEIESLLQLSPLYSLENRLKLDLPIGLSRDYVKWLAQYYLDQTTKTIERIAFDIKEDRKLRVGDFITLPKSKPGKIYKIESTVNHLYQHIEAVHVSNFSPKLPSNVVQSVTQISPPSTTAWVRFWDIPLLEAGLRVSILNRPWSGNQVIEEIDNPTATPLIINAPSIGGRLLTKIPTGHCEIIQNQSFEIELTNGQLKTNLSLSAIFSEQYFVIGTDESCELITAHKVEQIGTYRYRLSRLQRGIYGTESSIGLWDKDTAIAVLDPHTPFLRATGLAQQSKLSFSVGPLSDPLSRDIYQVNMPVSSTIPLAPTGLRVRATVNGIILSFIPRSREDHDYWLKNDSEFEYPSRFEIVISQTGREDFYIQSVETQVNLGAIFGIFIVKIGAISSSGQKGPYNEEIFYA